MLGTTHATNAMLERRRLAARRACCASARPRPARRPAAARLARRPARRGLGGRGDRRRRLEFDGREIAPFDREAAARFLERVARHGGGGRDRRRVLAASRPSTSWRARDLAREVLGDDIAVSLSHEIGSIGLIERENATVLNAALAGVATEVAAALERSLADARHRRRRSFFAQNDGTLMALDYALRYPVLTIGSGPGELAARRRVPHRLRATPSSPTSAGRRPTSACWSAASRASRPRRSRSAASARTSACPTSSRSRSAAGRSSARRRRRRARPRQRRLRAADESARVRRRHADADGRGGRRGARRRSAATQPPRRARRPARGGARGGGRAARRRDRPRQARARRPAAGRSSAAAPSSCRTALPGVSEILRPDHHDVANAIGAAIAMASGRWEEVGPGRPRPGRGDRGGRARRRATGPCRPAPTHDASRSSNSTRCRWPTSTGRPCV